MSWNLVYKSALFFEVAPVNDQERYPRDALQLYCDRFATGRPSRAGRREASSSLQIAERDSRVFRSVSDRVIVEDETGAVVQCRQIRPAVVVLAAIIIAVTDVAPPATPPRKFTSLDVNVE